MKKFKINVFELHLCNIRMTFPSQRGKALNRLVEKEARSELFNWYYHIIALERLNDSLYTELSRLYQHPGTAPLVDLHQILHTLTNLLKLYHAEPQQKTSFLLHKQLNSFLEIISSLRDYLTYELNLDSLTELFDLLLTYEKDSDLQRTLITLQKFIEWGSYDSICIRISEDSISRIIDAVKNQNSDIVQAAKDVLTFMAINSNSLLRIS